MFYVALRDMVLYLHKDEEAMKKTSLYENMSHAIRIHHSLATKATDYTKKQHVFRLHTADSAQFLFQTRSAKTVNFYGLSFQFEFYRWLILYLGKEKSQLCISYDKFVFGQSIWFTEEISKLWSLITLYACYFNMLYAFYVPPWRA